MLINDTGAKRVAWISALEMCESQGREDKRILDSNNKYSYGILMFQSATFHGFAKQYGLPHDDIYSREQQEILALNMLNSGGWRHWYNCAKKTTRDLGYAYPTDDTS